MQKIIEYKPVSKYPLTLREIPDILLVRQKLMEEKACQFNATIIKVACGGALFLLSIGLLLSVTLQVVSS